MEATARANTNISLIKAWGERDEALFLPMHNSISLTLDQFYTTTTVEFCENFTKDTLVVNQRPADAEITLEVSRFLDLVRAKAGKKIFAKVTCESFVPASACTAPSVSGFAALATAAVKALDLDMDRQELSKLARQGFGPACCSVYGGFVEWQKGSRDDGEDSFAGQLLSERDWRLSIISVVVSAGEMEISSRKGMRQTVEKSVFYPVWLESVEKDLMLAKEAIKERSIIKLGPIVEANALKMHATTLGADPPFTFWQSGTLEVMRQVQNVRIKGIPAYFTIDAGPNLHVLCLPEDEQYVVNRLSKVPAVENIYICHPGRGVSIL